MGNATITTRPVSGALGLEVRGVDLAHLNDELWADLMALWLEHHVLFFPDQHLDVDAHIDLARRFGEPEVHPFTPKLDDDHPEMTVLEGVRADEWHTDATFGPTPPMASVVQLVVCPPAGGDTIWTNQELAFATLSPPLQDLLLGLSAVHDASPMGRPEICTVHPAVREHPVTGRRALFVNRGFTSHFVELQRSESDALLEMLYRWCERPELQCRHRWTEGTVGIWDNRCTQHYGVADFSGRRVLHRVTVLGDRPVGPEPRWPAFEEAGTAAYGKAPVEVDPRTNSLAS